MINIANDIESLLRFRNMDVFSVQVFSLAKAYEMKYGFVDFWVQMRDEQITAIISRFYGNLTLSFSKNADLNEIEEFLSLLGFETLLCSDGFEMELNFQTGFVMKNTNTQKINKKIAFNVLPIPINDVFDLNKEQLLRANFDDFYTDMNHKIRHGVAGFFGIKVNDDFVSCAGCSANFEENIIISFVATSEEHRRKGLASAIIKHILQGCEKNCFLLTEKNRNESFYRKLGFKNIGKWRIYTR